MALKDQFQIKTIPAYEAADGQKFHDLAAAQAHTREQMLQATIRAAIKDRAEYSKLDNRLLVDFLLLAGKSVGAIMAEPLEPLLNEEIENRRMYATTAVKVAGTIDREAAERLARARNTSLLQPGEKPMPRAVNPDIFGDGSAGGLRAAMAAVDADSDESELEKDIERALATGT